VIPLICMGCKQSGADTRSGAGAYWHAACLAFTRSNPREYCRADRYPRVENAVELPKPWTDQEFLGMLTVEERRLSEPPDRLPWPYDWKYYADVLTQARAALPAWRKRRNTVSDQYSLPILDRPAKRGYGYIPTLRQQIAARKQREAQAAEAAKKAAKLDALRLKYGSKINAIAAGFSTASSTTLDVIRVTAREFFGVKKIESELPSLVKLEIARQEKVRSTRCSPHDLNRTRCPGQFAAEWPARKEKLAESLALKLLTHGVYKTPTHGQRIRIVWENDANTHEVQDGEKSAEWDNSRSRRYRHLPVGYSWNRTVLVAPTWRHTLLELEMHDGVEGMMVVSVGNPAPVANMVKEQAYHVRLVKQGVGSSLRGLDCVVYRSLDNFGLWSPWLRTTVMEYREHYPSRWDYIAGREVITPAPKCRKPARRRAVRQ